MVLCDPVSDEEYARRNRYCRRPYCHHPPRFFTIFLFKIHAIHGKYSTESRFCQGGSAVFLHGSARGTARRPPCPFLQRSRFLPADRSCPPGRSRTRRTEISINAYPCGRNPHFLPSFRAPAWRVLPAAYAGFSRGLFAKRPTSCAAALFLPRWYIFCNPARQRLLVRPSPRPGRIHGAPRFCHMPVPAGSEGGRPLYPPREGTPCAPSVPSRGIRRPARSGGGYRPGRAPCGANTAGSLRRKAA